MFLVVGIIGAVWYKVRQSRRGEEQMTKADEGAEPVRLQIVSDAAAEAKRRQSAGGATKEPVYEMADPTTPTSTGRNTAFLEPNTHTLDEFHRTSVV